MLADITYVNCTISLISIPPAMVSHSGLSSSLINTCITANPCRNGGKCLTTEREGVVCDCMLTSSQGLDCNEGEVKKGHAIVYD